MSSLIIFSNISGNDLYIFFPEMFTLSEIISVSNINVYRHVITKTIAIYFN